MNPNQIEVYLRDVILVTPGNAQAHAPQIAALSRRREVRQYLLTHVMHRANVADTVDTVPITAAEADTHTDQIRPRVPAPAPQLPALPPAAPAPQPPAQNHAPPPPAPAANQPPPAAQEQPQRERRIRMEDLQVTDAVRLPVGADPTRGKFQTRGHFWTSVALFVVTVVAALYVGLTVAGFGGRSGVQQASLPGVPTLGAGVSCGELQLACDSIHGSGTPRAQACRSEIRPGTDCY